jgi:hypothetical protein
MSVYSLRNALELYQKNDERRRFGAIILMDLSVEYALKAKLYQINAPEFIGNQNNLGFKEVMNDKRIEFLEHEKGYLWKVHEIRNFAQHRVSIPDSLNAKQSMIWLCKFIERFSRDNFKVDVNDELEIYLRKTWVSLTIDADKTLDKTFSLSENLEDYKTVMNWIRSREENSRTRRLQWNYKYGLIYHLKKYCEFVRLNPDQIVEFTKKGMFNPNELFPDFLASKTKSSSVPFSSDVKSFLAFHKIALDVSYPWITRSEQREITTDEIRKLVSVAKIQDSSWILANSYMGLNVNAITLLKVQDFNVENWNTEKPLYYVKIRKEVNGYKDYITFIGKDAMLELKKLFDEKQFSPQDRPWNCVRPTMLNYEFSRYAKKCKIYEKNGQKLSPKSMTVRLRRILKEEMPHPLASYVLGLKPDKYREVDKPLDDVVIKAYEKALPKLQIV